VRVQAARCRFELRGQKIYDGSALFHTEKQYYNSNGSTLASVAFLKALAAHFKEGERKKIY